MLLTANMAGAVIVAMMQEEGKGLFREGREGGQSLCALQGENIPAEEWILCSDDDGLAWASAWSMWSVDRDRVANQTLLTALCRALWNLTARSLMRATTGTSRLSSSW